MLGKIWSKFSTLQVLDFKRIECIRVTSWSTSKDTTRLFGNNVKTVKLHDTKKYFEEGKGS